MTCLLGLVYRVWHSQFLEKESNFIFFTILQQDNENENKETKMNRLYFIQVTFLLYSIACVDGQALYEDKCVTKDAKDVEQFKGNSLFIIHIL